MTSPGGGIYIGVLTPTVSHGVFLVVTSGTQVPWLALSTLSSVVSRGIMIREVVDYATESRYIVGTMSRARDWRLRLQQRSRIMMMMARFPGLFPLPVHMELLRLILYRSIHGRCPILTFSRGVIWTFDWSRG